MFAYCNNSPVNYVDFEGTDAIYVTDNSNSSSVVAFFGHAVLYYQDENNLWRCTQFVKNDGLFAKRLIVDYEVKKEDIRSLLTNPDYEVKYLIGDYSLAKEYASKYVGTRYGGYDLFENNCLHYVHNVINYARYGNNKELYDGMNSFVPRWYKVPKDKRPSGGFFSMLNSILQAVKGLL